MSTIRVSKYSNYSCINNQPIRNTCLSWAARGLLTYLLSMPDDWTANVDHLATQGPSGRDHIYTLLRELEAAGYLCRSKMKDARGRWTWEHVLHETPKHPEIPNETPSTAEPDLVKPEIKEVLIEQVLNQRTPLPPNSPTASEHSNGSPKQPVPPFNSVGFTEALNAFRDHRKEIKEPLTVRAEEILFKKLSKWGELQAIEALENAVLNRWRGVFEPKSYPPNGYKNLPTQAEMNAGGRGKLVL